VSVPFFSARDVEAAVSAGRAYDAVREAFIAHARGEWTMQPKLYVTNYPAGDFRAMPALGGGHALLKWVTSFPGNPQRGLPTVSGLVVLSDASTGLVEAVLDAGTVTALRTGAAASIAAETLGGAGPAAVIGAGVNGRAAAASLKQRGRDVALWDVDGERARVVASALGIGTAPGLAEALAAPIVVTVTPGKQILLPEGSLRPGQHVSLMGADGPGKAEIAVAEIRRTRIFCDEWEQASHGGEVGPAVRAGSIAREDVTELGSVLAGEAEGRRAGEEITIFDSTGLAIQDLAVAIAAFERADELDLVRLEL
jgi:alanine dehydrogenase